VHQAYIERMPALPASITTARPDLGIEPGAFRDPRTDRKLLGMPVGNIRVTPAEIGGGFGGKTVVYLEPVRDAARARRPGSPSRS